MGNPDHEALQQLKTDVTADAPDIGGKFNSIAERMGNSTVWYGTQADVFSTDLTGQKTKLSDGSGELVGDVEDRLAQVPAE